jgi:ADP-ribose 1''-phosphate phosphatase
MAAKLQASTAPFTPKPTTTTLDSVPADSYIAHATNCLGTWGSGFAKDLAALYPEACKVYEAHCEAQIPKGARWPTREALAGTSFHIPASGDEKCHIVNLFTSYGYGGARAGKPGRDSKARVMAQTEAALRQMRQDLGDGEGVVIYSPMINAGSFRVEWEVTQRMIETVFEGWKGEWYVLKPPA